MSKQHEIHVSFGIYGFTGMSHEELSNAIGVKPTILRVKGMPISEGSAILAKENSWILKSPKGVKDLQTSVEDQLNELLEILRPNKERIKEVCKNTYNEFSFTLYIYTDNDESAPTLYLQKEQIELINYLGADCDFDIILVSKTMPEGYDVNNW